MIPEFHFLRPEWFYAIIPVIALYMILRYREGRGSAWERTIDPKLLPFLLEKQVGKPAKNPRFILVFGWLLAICALAGPVWEQTPQPVHERENALVIVLDLTRSMYATDVKPNRLVRARRKLADLLAARKEGVTGLIVYSGDAHLVSPLTDDAKTIAELIPSVSPSIMPAPGSQLAPAITLAQSLFTDAGIASGRILIVTDEIRDVAQAQAVARQSRYAFPVSVLAVGTKEGAPILDPTVGYLRNSSGQLVIPKVDLEGLREFANVAGGRFSAMTLIDSDLEYLLAEQPLEENQAFRETDRDFDIWYEEGPWLLLLLLPLAALGFRRGWLWQIGFVCLLPLDQAHASLWDDLWQNGNQQGQQLMEANAPEIAAEKFDDPAWQATANYRAQNFEAAAKTFSDLGGSDGSYNAGNALAKAGQYEAAIEAYNQALTADPDNEDARFNKSLVEELLKSKQDQQQEDGEGEDQQNQDQQQNDGEGDQSQDSNDQQSEDGEQQESQDADQQETEQQQQAEQQEQQEGEAQDQQFSESDTAPLTDEEQQALEQWLRKVPDDPGGLLRRKFEMQYQERLKRRGVTNQNDDASNW